LISGSIAKGKFTARQSRHLKETRALYRLKGANNEFSLLYLPILNGFLLMEHYFSVGKIRTM